MKTLEFQAQIAPDRTVKIPAEVAAQLHGEQPVRVMLRFPESVDEKQPADLTVENVSMQHIETTPGIAGGKPRIAGHRITVQNIVIWYERMGLSADEIATKYDLTLAEVYAALAYYDHRADIDHSIRADDAFVTKLRDKTPSVLKDKQSG